MCRRLNHDVHECAIGHAKRHHVSIGIALGSGSSRGWSHIGIIRALAEIGVEPDIVCGCSVGAIVGASYAAGNLNRLERWVTSLTRTDVARFLDVNLSLSGFVDSPRLRSFFAENVCAEDILVERLARTFATVSTDLETGREFWFTEGAVLDAVWASMSLPGLFPPLRFHDKWLVDGGLVNPVPVSLCRALGADIVIAVNLNAAIAGRHFIQGNRRASELAPPDSLISTVRKTVRSYSASLFGNAGTGEAAPGLFDAISGSLNIMQERITRSRMAGDPPDIILAPRLSHIGLMEYYRAREAIQEGRECVGRMLPEIRHLLRSA
jgi:NTE family protein